MTSMMATLLVVLGLFVGQCEGWVAAGIGRRPGYGGFGRPGVAVYRRPAVAVYRRPVFYGRRLMEDESAGADDGVGEVKDCPIDLVALIPDDTMKSLVAACGDFSSDEFCTDCVSEAQIAISGAWADQDDAALEAARSDATVVAGCGQAVVDHLANEGVAVDDAFYTKLDECMASTEHQCPIDKEKLDGEMLSSMGDECLQVFYEASGTADEELDETKYCGSCYWPILGFIVNDKALGDDFWCTFKKLNETGDGIDTEEGERKVFEALYDDQDFIACSFAVIDKIGTLDADDNGEPDGIDVLGDPFAVRRQKDCWAEANLPPKGSILSDEMRKYIDELKCPAADGKDDEAAEEEDGKK